MAREQRRYSASQSRIDWSIRLTAKWPNLGNTTFPRLWSLCPSSSDKVDESHSCSGGRSSAFQSSSQSRWNSSAVWMVTSCNTCVPKIQSQDSMQQWWCNLAIYWLFLNHLWLHSISETPWNEIQALWPEGRPFLGRSQHNMDSFVQPSVMTSTTWNIAWESSVYAHVLANNCGPPDFHATLAKLLDGLDNQSFPMFDVKIHMFAFRS